MSSRMNPSTWWLAILSPLLEACHSPRTASHLIKRSSWWRNPALAVVSSLRAVWPRQLYPIFTLRGNGPGADGALRRSTCPLI
ncbi:uncharacterized protein CCOS01_05930 [Colletotrichum costaricense]|uniref:Secreted protein n=1 Tax=Colletotrichum costaricense TaxID=1209916 RepID=A0AAI9Z2M5_9PEZI|nr:uncharacterized protein CCOS01_05930 [Colletotrichum costaricense]KAK1530827.1 hypothetical protein CCOS01_05930 [Colletotrichum costaricense]